MASSTVIAKRAARQIFALAAMEGEDRLRVERPEAEQPQGAQLAPEAARRDVDPLLAGLQLAGEAVVDEDGVGGGQPPPLLRRRLASDPLPVREVRGQLGPASARARPAGLSSAGGNRSRRRSRVRQGASHQLLIAEPPPSRRE